MRANPFNRLRESIVSMVAEELMLGQEISVSKLQERFDNV
jgi:hypothetical protein